MRARLAAALLLLAVLSFAACGGNDDDAPGPSVSGGATATPTGPPATTRTPGPAQSLAPTSTPAPGATEAPSTGPTAGPEGTTYTVQSGDTLYSIAQRYGVTVAAVSAANGVSDPAQIAVGQVLTIPGGGVNPTAGPTAPPVTQPPSGGGPAQVIRTGNASSNTVALTFDAGSDAGYTAMILDTLAANGIRASFGMTGAWAERYPDLLRRIVNEGHTLINHSYTHGSFTGNSTGASAMTQAQRWDELDRTEAKVQELIGATTKPHFRPPFGDYDQSVNDDVGARGYAYNVMWTVDSRGWMGLGAPQITQRCVDLAEPGAIYVFHVGSASEDGPALQGIIDGLRADGYLMGDINDVLAP